MKMLIKIFLVLVLFLLFNSYGLALPRGFTSTLIPLEIQYQISDPLGNITGFSPINNTILNNIPNYSYTSESEPMGR